MDIILDPSISTLLMVYVSSARIRPMPDGTTGSCGSWKVGKQDDKSGNERLAASHGEQTILHDRMHKTFTLLSMRPLVLRLPTRKKTSAYTRSTSPPSVPGAWVCKVG
eukprot:753530-Hanusia_phi.AAC.4